MTAKVGMGYREQERALHTRLLRPNRDHPLEGEEEAFDSSFVACGGSREVNCGLRSDRTDHQTNHQGSDS